MGYEFFGEKIIFSSAPVPGINNDQSLTDKNDIGNMCANHFEDLGKPSVSPFYDHDFSDRVATRIRNIFASCQYEPPPPLPIPQTSHFSTMKFSTYARS